MEARRVQFKTSGGRWFVSSRIVLWIIAPILLYLAGGFVGRRDSLLAWFCLIISGAAGVIALLRAAYLARYRLIVTLDRAKRVVTLRERRLRWQHHEIAAEDISELQLIIPVPGAGLAHLVLKLSRAPRRLPFGWELGHARNRRLFRLLRRFWHLTESDANHYVLVAAARE